MTDVMEWIGVLLLRVNECVEVKGMRGVRCKREKSKENAKKGKEGGSDEWEWRKGSKNEDKTKNKIGVNATVLFDVHIHSTVQ